MSAPAPTGSVLLVSDSQFRSVQADDAELLPALEALGMRARWVAWDHPGEDLSQADLVLLRSTWDYSWRLEEFLSFTSTVPTLANPHDVVEWNATKTYLADLSAAGVATVPSQVVDRGDRVRWPAGEVVVKPAVGAGGRLAGRFDSGGDRSEAAEHLARLHARGVPAIVQPYLPSVDAHGERAMVYFGGAFSHVFGKTAPLPQGALDERIRSHKVRARPDPACYALGERAMDAAATILGRDRSELLYARVDLVPGEDDEPLLLEMELIEPDLGMSTADLAAPFRFASAVRQGVRARRHR